MVRVLVCVCVVQQPNSGPGRLVVEVSISHTTGHTNTDTVGLL